MRDNPMTWEEAVLWLRSQPEQQELVRACFFDEPLIGAAERLYHSSEWAATRALLPPPAGRALDLGAGRGICSYALAKDGWETVAIEPDPSSVVGAGAIRNLSSEAGLRISVEEDWGEELPFEDESFDLVYCRQVLHHSGVLEQVCREVFRVLKPGGTFLAAREHVISSKGDLEAFFQSHPLHRLYGGENAYTLAEYRRAIVGAGIMIERVFNPKESEINLYPETFDSLRLSYSRKLGVPARLIPDGFLAMTGKLVRAPGRLYTFLGRKHSGG